MTTIPNATLIDLPSWDTPKTTVNGQQDDQAFDEECFQALANRDKWLRTKLSSGTGSSKTLLHSLSETDSAGARWRGACPYYSASSFFIGFNGWTINSVEVVPLFFPLDFLPLGTIITGGSAKFVIPSGHSALPEHLPRFGLVRNYSTSLYCYSDPLSVASLSEYNGATIETAFPTLVESVDERSMALFVVGESGEDALPGIRVHSVTVTYTSPFAI